LEKYSEIGFWTSLLDLIMLILSLSAEFEILESIPSTPSTPCCHVQKELDKNCSNSCPWQPKIDRYMCSISSSQTNREAIIPSPHPPTHTQGWFTLVWKFIPDCQLWWNSECCPASEARDKETGTRRMELLAQEQRAKDKAEKLDTSKRKISKVWFSLGHLTSLQHCRC
jgi:hypothetical protein